MSVRDINKVIIVTNGLTGQVVDTIKLDNYSSTSVLCMLEDLMSRYILDNEQGLIVKVGYNN